MRWVVAILVAACGIGTALAEPSARQAAAGSPIWPWCAEYSMDGAVTNCGFATREQCIAAVSGNGGGCYRNPFASPPQSAAPGIAPPPTTTPPARGSVRSSAR